MLKQKTWRSAKYLAFVRSLPCCFCGQPADDPHHIKGLKFGSVKPPDFTVMPLCRRHHDMVHAAPWDFKEQQARWMIQTLDRAFSEGMLKA